MARRDQFATEEYVIHAAAERFGRADHGAPVEVGIGDDAAVLHWRLGQRSIATSDLLVEGVHFDLRYMTLGDVGWKALVANISDAAAMGAHAGWAIGQFGLPPGATTRQVDALLDGVQECAEKYGVRIVGGDTVAAPQWLVGFTLLADAPARPMLRSAAKPGDQIYLGCDVETDRLGHSQMGLFHLWGKLQGAPPLLPRKHIPEVTRWHKRPAASEALGRWLAKVGCRCCIDTSDSLAQSLLHIARASKVSIDVGFGGGLLRYDWDPALQAFARDCGWPGEDGAATGFTVPAEYSPDGRPQSYASLAEFMLSAAEDFQLVFTVSPELEQSMHGNPTNLIKLGSVGPAGRKNVYTDEFGRTHELRDLGWKHR